MKLRCGFIKPEGAILSGSILSDIKAAAMEDDGFEIC